MKKLKIVLLIMFVFVAVGSSVPNNAYSGEYNSYEKRDPFVPLVGVEGMGNHNADANVFTIDSVVFQGVAFDDKGDKNAIISGELMKVGDKLDKMEIVSITEEYVSVRIGDKTHIIRLYE